jgi:hypothetical protein
VVRAAGRPTGLVGVVEADVLRALIDRRHPASGEALGGAKQPTVRPSTPLSRLR